MAELSREILTDLTLDRAPEGLDTLMNPPKEGQGEGGDEDDLSSLSLYRYNAEGVADAHKDRGMIIETNSSVE